MNKRQKRFNKIYNQFLNILEPFNDMFYLGLLTGTIILAIPIYRFKGLAYALSPFGQFHLISVNILYALCPLSYFLLTSEQDNRKRVLFSLCFPILVFSLHDIAWLFETHFVQQVYLNNQLYTATLLEYFHHYTKNLANIIFPIAIIWKYKYFKITKGATVIFIGYVLFHLINIVFQINVYILNGYALAVMEIIDSLPYLALIKRKQKNGGVRIKKPN